MTLIDQGVDDWAKARRELAADRSNQDAEQSNDNFRLAAQSAILINGGAASAVLAFLAAAISKSNFFDPIIFSYAGYALLSFALGVAGGMLAIWCMNHALRHWEQSWQEVMKDPASEVVGTVAHRAAEPWYRYANRLLAVAILCFVVAIVILICGFEKSSLVTGVAPAAMSAAPSAPPSAPPAAPSTAAPPAAPAKP